MRNGQSVPQSDRFATLDREGAVRERYTRAARRKEHSLCCPVSYDSKYLKVIPEEILQKDYGCGDPSPFLREGDEVLDLGSGAGKICFIASQIAGPKGRVIGVDFNPEMLALAKKYQREIGERIGWQNVEFRRARIQDLRTDLGLLEKHLAERPLRSSEELFEFEERVKRVGREAPLIPDESIDIVISSCVLNLVRPEDRGALFKEMYRVLRRGGRAAISDIVSDEPVPEELERDPDLWTGCLSGAFQEKEFLQAFEEAGFYGIQIEKRDEKSWRTVQGIEFRSVTVTASKGKEGACWERNQAVIYKGPWREVEDDDRHLLRRGVRTAVCDKTYQIFSEAPYREDLILVPPRKNILLSKAKPFDCSRTPERDPRETKGVRYKKTTAAAPVCAEGGCC